MEASEVAVDEVYEDRSGKRWRIVQAHGQHIAPVTAARWEGKHYSTRAFQKDGKYYKDKEDAWDLIKKVESDG